MIRIATWNINSVRLRLPLVLDFLHSTQVDVLCLQETKVQNADFPLPAFHTAGYPHTLFHGQKSYNGVAIISRVAITEISREQWVNDDARHIAARLPSGAELHNLYIPAGGDIPNPDENPKFAHKLAYVKAATDYFRHKASQPIIAVGDFNIAPLECDVWSHKQLLDVVSHTPVEVELLTQFQTQGGFTDIIRQHITAPQKLYSWWSYRNRDWRASDRGRRLDHIWVTSPLQNNVTQASIARDQRDGQQPSDHVPVVIDITL